MNRSDDQAPPAPLPCANNCGFYGSEATKNLCSQCYSDLIKRSYPSVSATATSSSNATASAARSAAAANYLPNVKEVLGNSKKEEEFCLAEEASLTAAEDSTAITSPTPATNTGKIDSTDGAASAPPTATEDRTESALLKPCGEQQQSEPSDTAESKTEIGPSCASATTSAAAAVADAATVKPQKAGRCAQCNKKTGLLGFQCKCGYSFCSSHRYPSDHLCTFNFRQLAQEHLSKTNQRVIAAKLARI